MKTVYSNQEGVRMNYLLDFGDTADIIDEFNYLMETYETMWDAKFKYFYRITDDNYIQLASSQDRSQLTIKAQFELRYEDLKPNITFILREHIEAHLPYDGFPRLIDNSVLSKEEFEAIIQSIKDEKSRQAIMANAEETPLINYLKQQKLYPEPTGNNLHSWVCKCPSGGKHYLMVSTKNDEWGCGYCKRKGKKPELEKWLQEIKIKDDQNRLSKMLKELKEHGAIKSKDLTTWWLNRY